MKEWGCVLLAGGRGSRMGGVNKGSLTYEGITFGERIGAELSACSVPCFLSEAVYEKGLKGFLTVRDQVRDPEGQFVGPMGGIYSCLCRAEELGLKGLFFVSCDMPFFRKEMAQLLMASAEHEDAVLWRTRDGRLHPVCGFYSVNCLLTLEARIKAGDYRLMALLKELSCRILDTSSYHLPDVWFENVNTPEIYKQLSRSAPPVLAVSGSKNTGKTTCLENIVKILSAAGLRLAVIKHDGHDFVPDTPGTDSFRMKAAGAYGTVVYSAGRFSMTKDERDHGAEDFFRYFPEADLILLEGQKASAWPKLETLRREISAQPVCRPETVIAYVKDWREEGEDSCLFEETDAIAEAVIRFLDRERGKISS